ncbi:MAG: ATP-dependent helicase, partial [Lachnospiraceae bacterium]|nr:ATP-dependent helicase [Lachnospiraceae bacterium]
ADCYVLYDEADLNKHFMLLNQTKISIQEIQQIWRAIKEMTRRRAKFSSSALELARAAGWDETVREVETRVRTAINALEEANYIKRGENIPHVYADSMLVRSVMEAQKKLAASKLFTEAERQKAVQIIGRLLKEDTRVDYVADHLGLEKSEVLRMIQKLREAQILADAKDLTAYIDETGDLQKMLNVLRMFGQLEAFLFEKLEEQEEIISIKQLNEEAQAGGLKKSSVGKIICVLNFWSIKGFIEKKHAAQNRDAVQVTWRREKENIRELTEKQRDVAEFILYYLDNIKELNTSTVTFSVLELVEQYNYEKQMLALTANTRMVENALLYLSKMGILKLEGGFLVSYSALSIERLEQDNKIRYKVEDYRRLKLYYEQKVQMIHIVGEYAKKVTTDYQEALQFVEDYFQMEYTAFLRKYFRGERGEEIRRNITQKKFEQLFGALSPAQLQIIKDKEAACIVVAAGPGSGKTKILVHKLASLLLLEDVKHEQLLMLTFSRAAAMEFRQRLYALIENSAAYVEIKTFHSYCFDLLGRVGSLQCSENVVRDAVKGIEDGEVEASRITKTVLVIDEAQDMDEQEYRLVQALLDKNDDIRVIAVGDDDQNIYEFRGASSVYMDNLRKREGARLYELVENFRSLSNLVAYTNHFATCISERMKTNPIVPVQKECGRITVVEYRYPNLVFPVVQKLMEDGISKNTCVLTWKNDTALQVTGLFCKQGRRARLVQEKEDFPLKNLREVRYFCALLQIGGGDYIIDENRWDTAKRELRNVFGKSSQYEPCSNMIEIFEKSNPRMKYVSDWKLYLEESHIGDFYRQDREEEICVSTMHKAKGHEYEHVVLLLDDFKVSSEADKRLLYVAMTRAKKTLAIHYAGTYLRRCGRYAGGAVPYLNYEYDEARYPASGLLIFQTGMKDVYLSYFYKSRNLVKKLCSGDEVRADESGCLDARGNRLMLYSKSFKEKLQKYFAGGYRIARARISFMYHWHEEGREDEALVMLPQLELVNGAVQAGNAACTVE